MGKKNKSAPELSLENKCTCVDYYVYYIFIYSIY